MGNIHIRKIDDLNLRDLSDGFRNGWWEFKFWIFFNDLHLFKDIFDASVFFDHLLVVTSALEAISGLDELVHFTMDFRFFSNLKR